MIRAVHFFVMLFYTPFDLFFWLRLSEVLDHGFSGREAMFSEIIVGGAHVAGPYKLLVNLAKDEDNRNKLKTKNKKTSSNKVDIVHTKIALVKSYAHVAARIQSQDAMLVRLWSKTQWKNMWRLEWVVMSRQWTWRLFRKE